MTALDVLVWIIITILGLGVLLPIILTYLIVFWVWITDGFSRW